MLHADEQARFLKYIFESFKKRFSFAYFILRNRLLALSATESEMYQRFTLRELC